MIPGLVRDYDRPKLALLICKRCLELTVTRHKRCRASEPGSFTMRNYYNYWTWWTENGWDPICKIKCEVSGHGTCL